MKNVGGEKLEIRYTVKTMEEIIAYWIEAVHISNRLESMYEYTDDSVYSDKTLTRFAAKIDEASCQAYSIRKDAGEKLKAVISSGILTGAGEFAGYMGSDYEDRMDDLIDMLYGHFDEIYGYSQEEQTRNFYRVLWESLDKLLSVNAA